MSDKRLAVLNEVCNVSKTFFSFSEKGCYFLSDTVYQTMAARLSGLGKYLKKSGCIRNMALAEIIAENPETFNMVVRREDNLKKIYALFKSDFKKYEFSSLVQLTDALEDIQYVSWRLNHRGATVYLEFNRMWEAGYYPGIILCLSDTGYVRASVLHTCRHKNHSELAYQILDREMLREYLENEDKTVFVQRVKEKEHMLEAQLEALLEKKMDTVELCEKARLKDSVGKKKRIAIGNRLLDKNFKNMQQELEFLLDINDKDFSELVKNHLKTAFLLP